MRRISIILLTVMGLGACGGEAPPPPPAEEPPPPMTRADSVEMALARFDSTVFDTIQWQTPEAATDRGALVYRVSCMTCHGENGRGDRAFVAQGDTLRPPSFLGPRWQYAKDPMGLRRRIFTGSVAGMRYWGLVGMTYKDVDAVARYITQVLR